MHHKYLLKKQTLEKKAKNLNLSTKKPLANLKKIIKTKHISALRDLKIEINKSNSNIIVISGLNAKIKAANLSCLLGVEMQQDNQRIAHIDFSNKVLHTKK